MVENRTFLWTMIYLENVCLKSGFVNPVPCFNLCFCVLVSFSLWIIKCLLLFVKTNDVYWSVRVCYQCCSLVPSFVWIKVLHSSPLDPHLTSSRIIHEYKIMTVSKEIINVIWPHKKPLSSLDLSFVSFSYSWGMFSPQDPKERLGCQVQTGFTDIKSHTFFRSIDWDQVSICGFVSFL